MAVRLGAEKSEFLTAIGTFAGKVGLSVNGAPFAFTEAPATPLSVQMTYGTLDPNYAGELKTDDVLGNIQATSAQAGIDWWTDSLGCDPAPQKQMRGQLTFETYSGSQSDSVVRMVTVEGMGHTWPEKRERHSKPVKSSAGLDGTKLLLDFFGDKVKPARMRAKGEEPGPRRFGSL